MNLCDLEQRFSGGRTPVKRRRVSPLDPRLEPGMDVAAIPGKMLSGGRFLPNRFYAETYVEKLAPFMGCRFVLAELGVLLGVGLAVWCDVFPLARIVGFDVDPDRFDAKTLKSRGAFSLNKPEVHFLDELADDASERVARAFNGERIDVMIDDALHDDASILKAMQTFMPFMAERFIYFVEDNATVDEPIRSAFPNLNVSRQGKLTVVSNG